MKKIKKTPWPTKAVMNQIYEQNLWGGKQFDFYSGTGSHELNIIKPYLEVLTEFLNSFASPLIVCDLGCGDFNIGKHLIKHAQKYIGVDIVKALIERNKKLFKADNLEFQCLDISKDELPNGDCIILRQVLQHLSNAEIDKILKKIQYYKYIILTEHLPASAFIPNKDIISGQAIRIKQNSGVNILETPFNFKITEEKILANHILEHNKGCILTTLYKTF